MLNFIFKLKSLCNNHFCNALHTWFLLNIVKAKLISISFIGSRFFFCLLLKVEVEKQQKVTYIPQWGWPQRIKLSWTIYCYYVKWGGSETYLCTIVTKSQNIQKKYLDSKGQLISKANCQAVNSSKKWTNVFVFTSIRRVYVRYLEEIEDSTKTFRNYRTFKARCR